MSLLAPQPVISTAAASPTTPRVHWAPCGDGFECATVPVPLDHDGPSNATIQIALIRLPSTNPDQRIGSLFINPGGPGGSGVDIVRRVGKTLLGPLRERFDIVGFDPRGVARSTPLNCFGSIKRKFDVLSPLPFPVTPEEEASWEESDRDFAESCERQGREIMNHMATADVARDLDLLRQAVGDEYLNYHGVSYGSYLGVTYANLFPERVGRFVIDGILDPVAWSTGSADAATTPFTTRLRSDKSSMETLGEFFRLCDEAGGRCAFSGDAEGRFAALAERLRATPVNLVLPDGSDFRFTYAHLIATTRMTLYNPPTWRAHARFLALLESEASAAEAGSQFAAVLEWAEEGKWRDIPVYPNFNEAFAGIGCSDSDNPSSHAAWAAAADTGEAQYGYFSRFWTWISSICAVWPGQDDDRYMGPWTAHTANPVLIIGNLFDPATRYEGAVTVAGLLPNSRLLTYEGWGHIGFFRSPCVYGTMLQYLNQGVLPGEGAVCPAGPSPFAAGP